MLSKRVLTRITSPTVFLSQSKLRGKEGGSTTGPRGEVSGVFVSGQVDPQ